MNLLAKSHAVMNLAGATRDVARLKELIQEQELAVMSGGQFRAGGIEFRLDLLAQRIEDALHAVGGAPWSL